MKRLLIIIFPILILLHIILGIWWLAISWAIIWFIVWVCTTSVSIIVRLRRKSWLVYPVVMVGSVLAAIILKTLFFGIYKIPSGSMERTIVPGDVVWVNNLIYGPRLPYSPYEISWINGLVWLMQGRTGDVQEKWWPYRRLKGYTSPKRGDISVFNHPNHNMIFIKRIVALPGDTLQITDGKVFVNGEEQIRPVKSLYFSKVEFSNRDVASTVIDSLQLRFFSTGSYNETPVYSGALFPSQMEDLRHHPGVLNSGIDTCRADTAWTVYPHIEDIGWTIDNYGPYRLPYKGMVIEKNSENLMLYGQLISQEEEQNKSEDRSDNNGLFTFSNDYFFIIGDNFHDSEDSRYFGPVREDYLIGKATFILYSPSSKGFFSKIINRLY
jgi:signal peptidase I